MKLIDHPVINLIKRVLHAQTRLYGLVIVLTGLVALAELLPPRLMAYYTTQLSGASSLAAVSGMDFLTQFFIFGLGVSFILFISHFIWELAQEALYLKTESLLRRWSLDKLHDISLAQLDRSYRGEFLTQMTQDLNATERFIAVTLPEQVKTVLIFVGVTCTFIWHGGLLAGLLLISAFFLALINIAAQKKLRPIMEKLREIHTKILHLLIENYEGLATIRSLGVQRFVKSHFESQVHTIVERGFRLSAMTNLLGGANGLVTGTLTIGALTYVGWKVDQQTMTVAEALLYPFYIGIFYQSALAMLGMTHSWNDFIVRGRRVAEFLNVTPESDPIVGLHEAAHKSLFFKNIAVGYPGHLPLTRPFDFSIKPGEILLIRGESGAGKSTLLQTICGLRPFVQGELVLEKNTFQNFHWDKPWFMPCELSLLVEQKPYLFEGTVRSNLTMGQSHLHDNDIWRALTQVNLQSFIESAGGLDHQLLDQGRNLSEGQKYRLIVARALLIKRPCYCFDEPFAALDFFSIGAICDALHNLRDKGFAVILVSHTIPERLEIDRVIELGEFKPAPSQPLASVGEKFGEDVPLRN